MCVKKATRSLTVLIKALQPKNCRGQKDEHWGLGEAIYFLSRLAISVEDAVVRASTHTRDIQLCVYICEISHNVSQHITLNCTQCV